MKGLSKFSVRCIKQLSPGTICEDFFGVVNVSFDDAEMARLIVLSAKAAEHSF